MRGRLVFIGLVPLVLLTGCISIANPTPTPVIIVVTPPPAARATATPAVVRPQPTSTPTATLTPTSTPAPTLTPTPVITFSENISVTLPLPNSIVTGTVRVAGKARVFEANVQAEVVDSTGKSLIRRSTLASIAAPEWGDFSTELSFPPPEREERGMVRVFSESPRDGSIVNLVIIPIVLRPH